MQPSPLLSPADDQAGGTTPHFCPHCGHAVSPTDTFCQNCGYNLVTDESTTPDQPAAAPTQTPAPQPAPTAPQATRHPRSPQQKRRWWALGIVAVAAVGFGVWGGQRYSRAATLNRIMTDVQSGKHLTTDFASGSANLKLSTTKLSPVHRYYTDHAQALSNLKQQLLAGGRSDDGHFTYRRTGQRWLVFPKYQISVTPVYPTVTTNHAKTVITLDNRQIATADSDTYSKKLGALVPGEYHLAASGKVGSHQLSNSSDYHITSDKTYDLELKTVSVTFNTVPGAAIYLNSKKVGTADGNGTYAMKNEPWSDNMTVYAQYTSDAGTAKTNSALLDKNADGDSIDLKFPGIIDESDADDFISNLFTAIENLANNGDMADATDDDGDDLEDFFESGSGNTEFQQFKSMADGYYKDDDIGGTNTTTTIKAINPGPNRSSLVTYTVKYDFALDDYDHIQTFQYTATVADTSRDNDASLSHQIVKISPAQKINDYHDDED